MATQMLVKHLVLRVGTVSNPEANVMSGEEADNHVSDYIEQGFKLHTAAVISTQPEGINVFYLLTKPAPKE